MTLADLSTEHYDPKDPDPWLALALDQSLPIDPRRRRRCCGVRRRECGAGCSTSSARSCSPSFCW
ncbi:MAG: hypothetical protein R3C16_03900 [Hyphomonadaceae bacterium]